MPSRRERDRGTEMVLVKEPVYYYEPECTTETTHASSDANNNEIVDDKRAVWCAAMVYFFGSITIQAFTTNAFQYIKHLSPTDAGKWFFYSFGGSKLAQAFVLVVSSVFTNHYHKYRYNLIIGRILCIVGILAYMGAGAFSSSSTIIVLIAFLLVGASEGTNVIIRGYAPRFSSIKERASAMAIITTAGMGGFLFGPITNLCFSPFTPSNGTDFTRNNETSATFKDSFIISDIELNMYTLPCILLLAYNATAIVFAFNMKNPIVRSASRRAFDPFFKRFLNWIMNIFVGLDVPLFFAVLLMKAISAGCLFAVITTLPEHLNAVANTSETMNLILFNVGQITAGLLSGIFSVIYSVTKLGTQRYFHPMYSLIYALIFFAGFAVITVPWPFATPVELYDKDLMPAGCNTTKFVWCESTSLMSMYAWLPLGTLFLGIGMPLTLISLDTLYSRILDKSQHADLFQGLFALVECVTLGYVPIKAGDIYKANGPLVLYSIVAAVLIISCSCFAFLIPRFKRVLGIDDSRKTPVSAFAKDTDWSFSGLVHVPQPSEPFILAH